MSKPSRSHYSPRLKLMLQTQVTNPDVVTFQSFSKGVYVSSSAHCDCLCLKKLMFAFLQLVLWHILWLNDIPQVSKGANRNLHARNMLVVQLLTLYTITPQCTALQMDRQMT